MSYEVKTPVFEGPLDLLLQLITSHQVAITDLSLTDLVGEYLRHLEVMRGFDMEVTSEFLIIAATLIQLKARSLLPDHLPVDLDEELALAEERDRLLARLLSCLTFKDVAAVLAHRIEASARFVPRLAGIEPDIRPAPPEFRLGTSPEALSRIFAAVLERAQAEPEIDHLDMDLPSVDDAITDLRRRVASAVRSDFDALVVHCDRTIEVVAYFLALLELARWGFVGVAQEHRDAPIMVTHNPDPPEGDLEFFGASEWTGVMETAGIIEAILFSAEEPLTTEELAEVLELPRDQVEQELEAMLDDFSSEGRGIVLRRLAGGWRLYTHPDARAYLERFAATEKATRLSPAALETLAVVAYRQPVARSQIAEIRGVDSERALRTLEARGLVREIGRAPGPGQALLYGTTDLFLEQLGIDTPADLPPLADHVPPKEVVEALERPFRPEGSSSASPS